MWHPCSNRTDRFLVFLFTLAIAFCSFAAAAETPKSVQEKLALQLEEIRAHQGKSKKVSANLHKLHEEFDAHLKTKRATKDFKPEKDEYGG